MTTNDKPVCWQCRFFFTDGRRSQWYSFDSREERDERVREWIDKGWERGNDYETRDLYARPQPAAPQVPRRMDHYETHATPFREGYVEGWNACIDSVLARATPPAPEQPKPAGDVEALIAACVPGGSICDPQTVADNIRAYMAAQPAQGEGEK